MSRMHITPDQAETWLGHNHRNRTLRKQVVSRYARDMTNGKWLYNGEAIKFDIDGNLLDGQHRLQAIVESGVTVETEVVTGLAPDTQDVMDTGLKRSPGDMLALHGHPYVNMMAAAAKMALGVQTGDIVTRRFVPTSAEVKEWVDAHPDIVQSCENAKTWAPRADIRPALVAYTHWVLAQLDRQQADEFWAGVSSKVGLEDGDPRLALSHRLADLRRQHVRLPDTAYLSMIYRAWNAWRQGRPLRLVRASQNGSSVAIPVPR